MSATFWNMRRKLRQRKLEEEAKLAASKSDAVIEDKAEKKKKTKAGEQ